MSAKKEVYLLVKGLVSLIPEIKHWDVWNDNVNRDGEVDPFPTPAVFFEWTASSWSESTVGNEQNFDDVLPNQDGSLQFTLHIVIKKSKLQEQDELDHYDIEQLIYEAVHFKTVLNSELDFIEGKIQRFSDDTILRHNTWRDWPVVYALKVIECGKTGIDDGTIEDAQPIDFEVEPEFTITHSGDEKPGVINNKHWQVNRDKKKIQKRADFVKQFVNSHKGTITFAVKKCSERLFLSEKTIWNDLKKDCKD